MDLSTHSALSHYTTQMNIKAAAMAEVNRFAHTTPGPPMPTSAGAASRPSITDFFGKMIGFSSCQPIQPYYSNPIYTEKLESHL